MSRRVVFFICLLSIVFLPAVLTGGQQAEKVPRIGFLSVAAPIDPAFLEGLHELGYVDRKNVIIEYRSAEGKSERLPKLAADLVDLKVDVVVTRGTPAASAAKQVTHVIPIVMAISGGDLVKLGLVTSFSRPGETSQD